MDVGESKEASKANLIISLLYIIITRGRCSLLDTRPVSGTARQPVTQRELISRVLVHLSVFHLLSHFSFPCRLRSRQNPRRRFVDRNLIWCRPFLETVTDSRSSTYCPYFEFRVSKTVEERSMTVYDVL